MRITSLGRSEAPPETSPTTRSTRVANPGQWRLLVLDCLPILALALIGVVVLHPVFGAGFVLVDDHEILAFSEAATNDPQLGKPESLFEEVFIQDPALGRVRPTYWLIRFAQIAVLGNHAVAWHAFYVLIGIVSGWLMFATLRLAGSGSLPALIAALWLLVAPGVSSVWFRLGPVEGLGTTLVLLAAWAAARGAAPGSRAAWDWLHVITLCASFFVKESFTLVAPAFVGFRLLVRYQLGGRAGLMSSRAFVAALIPLVAGLFGLLIVYFTVTRSGAASYGGRVFAAAGAILNEQTRINLEIITWLGGTVVPLLALGVLIEAIRRRRATPAIKSWCVGAVIFGLLVIPQLMLYQGGAGFAVGRYILPTGIALAAGVAAGLTWLHAQRNRPLFVIITTIWVANLLVFSVWTWRDAELFRADSAQLTRTLDAIVGSAPPGATVAIAADPVETEEFAVSFPYQIAATGRSDLDTRLLAVPSYGSGTVAAQAGAAVAQRYFPGRADVAERGCSGIAAVVLFASESQTRQALPCLSETEFQMTLYLETVTIPDLAPPFLRQLFPSQVVGYSILIRADLLNRPGS